MYALCFTMHVYWHLTSYDLTPEDNCNVKFPVIHLGDKFTANPIVIAPCPLPYFTTWTDPRIGLVSL